MANVNRNISPYKFMPLSVIDEYVKDMRLKRVSEVARSRSGFLSAYRRADGNPKKLSTYWIAKRDAFIKRHMAQVTKHNESLGWLSYPSRRHLALIAWAYSPQYK